VIPGDDRSHAAPRLPGGQDPQPPRFELAERSGPSLATTRVVSRFAPSTTGEAHPGTLLAALLVWLDARSRGGRALLRLEDLDITRTKAVWSEQMVEACGWLGLAWDDVVIQSDRRAAHEAALDAFAAAGRLYPCRCSRATRVGGRRAPDGSWAYDNICRGRALPPGGWRAASASDAIRVQLDDDRIELLDDGGLDLSQTPARELGDPVVRRRDGVITYQLAVVIDDRDAAITDVIRGRDIAPSTATQVMLQRLLGLPTPRYRHHFLLLDPRDGKLAKLHGSIPFSQLRARYDGPALCGLLAHAAGLVPTRAPCSPGELVASFDWQRVPRFDRITRWDDRGLVIDDAPA
jgi:glutamyl/glutaminyl-tRNA synthetase